MGIYSHGELIWGIPVEVESGYEDDSPYLQLQDPGEDEFYDWVEPEWGELTFTPYGHYEDTDTYRAILTTTRVQQYTGDCWDPTEIPSDALIVSDKAISKSTEQARAAGFDVHFSDAQWNLVASVG